MEAFNDGKKESTIYPDLQQDILTLVVDTDEVKHGLEKLEQDCARWDRSRQRKDLTYLLEFLKRLENDVAGMQADWIKFACRISSEYERLPVFDNLKRAFINLNILFTDLKNLRAELNNAFIHSVSLNKFEVDWNRFWKTVKRIQEYLLNAAII